MGKVLKEMNGWHLKQCGIDNELIIYDHAQDQPSTNETYTNVSGTISEIGSAG